MITTPLKDLPQYQSKKTVRAVRATGLEKSADADGFDLLVEDFEPLFLSSAFVKRYDMENSGGGFLVIDDSVSHLLDENRNLSFLTLDAFEASYGDHDATPAADDSEWKQMEAAFVEEIKEKDAQITSLTEALKAAQEPAAQPEAAKEGEKQEAAKAK